MEEFEAIQLENMVGYFEKEPKSAAKYLEDAKNLHKNYVANGGEFVEDNYNDMKAYALDGFKHFDKIVKDEIKRLPAACKKTAEYKAARASYKAAMAELLAKIEAFEIDEVVDEVVEAVDEVVDEVVEAVDEIKVVEAVDEVVDEVVEAVDEIKVVAGGVDSSPRISGNPARAARHQKRRSGRKKNHRVAFPAFTLACRDSTFSRFRPPAICGASGGGGVAIQAKKPQPAQNAFIFDLKGFTPPDVYFPVCLNRINSRAKYGRFWAYLKARQRKGVVCLTRRDLTPLVFAFDSS